MKNVIYAMKEKKYYEYLFKIHQERHMFNELFFNVVDKEDIPKTSLLGEYYSLLYHIEGILLDIEESYDSKDQHFYVDEKSAGRLLVLMTSLMTVKDELLNQNVSLSVH